MPNPVHALRNGTIGWTLAGQTLAAATAAIRSSARASGARAAEVAHFAERAGVAVIDEATLQRWLQQATAPPSCLMSAAPKSTRRVTIPAA